MFQVAQLRSELEQQRLDLEKVHSGEMEAMLEKTNSRLTDIEKEYSTRAAKSTEVCTFIMTGKWFKMSFNYAVVITIYLDT